MSSKPIILSIEGNIGAGKTTLLRHLKSVFSNQNVDNMVVFMEEPVDLWESVRDAETGETILSKFYRDKEKYAFAFQIMAYTSRLEAFKRTVQENPGCKVIVCERSLEADRHIFAKMLRDEGAIDSVSYQVYEMLFKNTSWEFEVDLAVYLDADPAKCIERIERRARQGESVIPIEYLVQCKHFYDTWMSHMCEHTQKTVVHIDANVDTAYDSSTDIGTQWVDLVQKLVKSFL
jgi:deoxyadenosine/deoxycytidine kinase